MGDAVGLVKEVVLVVLDDLGALGVVLVEPQAEDASSVVEGVFGGGGGGVGY